MALPSERDIPSRGAEPTPSNGGGTHALRSADLALSPATIQPRRSIEALPWPRVLRLPLAATTATVTSIGLLDAPPKVSSYRFPRLASPVPIAPPRPVLPQPVTVPTSAAPEPAAGKPPRPGRTRIAPPGDVVRMEERLWFLLQPDLETLLRSCHLDFPRQPFPFQLEGMAFLMPRHAAVLADEMGLGKSMQAIS